MIVIKLIVEGLGLGALLVLICAVGIKNGAVGMVHLYDKKVQNRVIQLGMTTGEAIRRRSVRFRSLCLPAYMAYVLVCVYAVNGARGFLPGFWQGFVILSIMNLIDRLLIDEYWVGHTHAWVIPGTEDLRPYHMPEWAVYIETPGLSYERRPMEGFIAHLDYNLFSRGIDLQFAIFRSGIDQPKMIALPLGEGTLLDAMDRVDKVDEMFAGNTTNIRYVGSRDEYRQTFSSMLQLLLYLCSEEPDMPKIEHPQQRRRLSGGVRTPEAPRVWDVGVRVSAAIRRFNGRATVATENRESGVAPGSHASPRPHVRSAHWHTYWTGPRDAVFPLRKPVMRWIPPLPIGMDWKREMPTNIRMVGG